MTRSPSSSGLLPVPGSPSSSWSLYRARLAAMFQRADSAVLVAFWMFGLINNVLYVIILSAAQDLVGNLPKGVVLVADVLPSFLTKLTAPYFIHRIPYAVRVLAISALSMIGMLWIALTPPGHAPGVKLIGVMLASVSSGTGELSFLGLTHYYGHISLAAWGSGTGAAGLVGAGAYVLLTDWLGFSVKSSLLASALLPGAMIVAFFGILPRGPLQRASAKEYEPLPEQDLQEEDIEDMPTSAASSSLLAPGPGVTSTAYSAASRDNGHGSSFSANFRRMRSLFFPYMMPLLLVYIAEYTINQGVAPTLLFPLDASPFTEFRAFYPFYGFLYQLGVFISRTVAPFYPIHHLYVPSLLQVGNLGLLTIQAMVNFIPSVYIVFIIIFWEGLLGGAVYSSTFTEILHNVPIEDREFSLGATSVSDSAGICIAGLLGMVMEVWLCDWQVRHGRDWCRNIKIH
ncbi:batten's disease protein Cln3 [Thozetella sp. PMI_491]|nr:batten's disease protein Cln3 [Thozetella sp. PMI_491]